MNYSELIVSLAVCSCHDLSSWDLWEELFHIIDMANRGAGISQEVSCSSFSLTHTYTNIYTCTAQGSAAFHRYIHLHAQADMRTHIHTTPHTHAHTRTAQRCTAIYTYICMHRQTCTQTHTHCTEMYSYSQIIHLHAKADM